MDRQRDAQPSLTLENILGGPAALEEKPLRKGGRKEGKCGKEGKFSEKSLLVTISQFLQIQMRQNIY